MLVANVEFRFPLLRPFGASQGMYGPVPVEVALFADGGVAYCSGNNALFCNGDNRAVSSAGFALRVNLLGYAIGELDVVKPFQRPDKGWYLQFSLTPGF